MKKLLIIIIVCTISLSGCGNIAFRKWSYIEVNGGYEVISYGLYSALITVPDTYNGRSVVSIGYKAMGLNPNLREVVIPDSVTRLEDYAFIGCNNLESITLGKNVRFIGNGVFLFASKLEQIDFPVGLTEIGENAFGGMSRLKKITISEENPNFCVESGVLFSKDGKRLIRYPPMKPDEAYVIPDGVEVIGSSAFSVCNNLKSVTIPETVKVIGENAFGSCSNLTDIHIPDSIEEIQDDAFASTAWLKNQTQEYVVVNDRFLIAYNGAGPQITIPEGVTSVSCHQEKRELDKADILELSKDVSTISEGFWRNTNFTIFNCSAENQHFSLEGTALMSKDGKQYVRHVQGNVQTCVVPDGVEDIGDFALPIYQMENVVLPEGIKRIGDNAFGLSSLKAVELPESTTALGENAFNNCHNLKEIVIPENVVEIGAECFSGCSKLKKITIPSSVTAIGGMAFEGCDKVTIYGEKGSYIQKYAKAYGISFKAI